MCHCDILSIALAVLSASTMYPAEKSSYRNPHLLLEPEQLAEAGAAGRFAILDVRSPEACEAEHIPGAIRIDHDQWKEAFADGSDAEGWSKRIGELGIGADSTVVLYDGSAGKDAARIWWILRYWGVGDARLLNGGWKTWKAKGLAVSTETPDSPTPVAFKARAARSQLVTKDEVLKAIDDHRFQIIDSRSKDEFCGIDLQKNLRGGAIPGAKHLDWVSLVDPETDRFKTPQELQKLFAESGINPSQPTASHCQSGGRASVMVFALELMGAKDAKNYYAGWSEWGNLEDTPIVVSEEKETVEKSKVE